MDLAVSDSLCFYWKQVAAKSDAIYVAESQKFEQLTVVNESLQTALKDERRKSRKTSIGVGVGGTLLGILLGVLLVK